jgi:hypothetical protein
MRFNIGDKVMYNNEEYFVHWIYDTEYLEISKDKIRNCLLVHKSEIVKKE